MPSTVMSSKDRRNKTKEKARWLRMLGPHSLQEKYDHPNQMLEFFLKKRLNILSFKTKHLQVSTFMAVSGFAMLKMHKAA